MGKQNVSMLVKIFLAMMMAAVLVAGCGNQATSGTNGSQQRTTIKLGVTHGPSEEVATKVKEIAAKDGLTIDLVVFSDGSQVNRALAEKQIDANSFQHGGYFENDKKSRNLDLVKIADTYTLPAAIYSTKIKNVADLPDGATVALAGDPANTARCLMLFEKAGWIKLKQGLGIKATVRDVVDNPKHIKFKEMDQAMIAPVLGDVDAAAINTNHALAHGLHPAKNGILVEDANGPWVNLIAVRTAEKDDPVFQKLIKAFHSDELKQFINAKYQGTVIAGW